MTRRRGQRDGIIQSVVVIDEQRLPSFHDRQTVISEYRARRVGTARMLRFPGSIFPLVKNVLRIGERRNPTSVAQGRIPACVVDMEMRAEHVINLLIAGTEREQLLPPAL